MLDPFRKDMWTVWIAYVLGAPMPKCLQPLGMHGAYQPCRCNGHPIPDAAGHHKMNCPFSSKSAGHQHIEDTFAKAAHSACVECTTSKTQVPTHLADNKQGDALINLAKNADADRDWKNVVDFTIVHPFSSTGEWKNSAMTTSYNKKMEKHGRPYEIQKLAFVPCVLTTYGAMQDDFVRLLYIMARRQAESIIAYHRPEADFDCVLGQCFSGFKGRFGAACARAMALRALSYNKFGLRRPHLARVHKPHNRDQNLHVNAVPVVAAFVAAAL
jgi:hypothetical protein